MTIGELLKKNRLEMRLTQKQMCAGVMSVSYYSKIENNTHRIGAADLIGILNKQSISPAVFFHDYNSTLEEKSHIRQILYDLYEAYYAHNGKKIQQLLVETKEADIQKSKKEIVVTEIKLIDAILKEDYSTISPKDKLLLKHNIFWKDNWSKFTLSLFANSMVLFTTPEMTYFVEAIFKMYVKRRDKEKDHKRDNIIMTIAINFISTCIKNDEDELTTPALKILDSIQPVPENTFYKLTTVFYESLLKSRMKSEDQAYIAKIQCVLSIFKEIGLKQYSEDLNAFYMNYRTREI